jgi:hypothetical protein
MPHARVIRLLKKAISGRTAQPPGEEQDPPPIVQHPIAAWYLHRAGKPVAFRAPLRDCVIFNGFAFGSASWHPFVATLEQCAEGAHHEYSRSILEKFFGTWQPRNAAEALIGVEPAMDGVLHTLPAYAPPLPWQGEPPEEWVSQVKAIIHRQNRENGQPDLTIQAGFNHHGPVSDAKGVLEYQRLVRVFDSLQGNGYDRRQGDIKVTVLRRGAELRYLVMSGHHRAAAAAVLECEEVPCVFGRPDLVCADEIEYWPLVQSGVWSIQDAQAYLDHVFDFDARGWAVQQGLVRAADNSAPKPQVHRC